MSIARILFLSLTFTACGGRPPADRPRELAQCQIVSRNGDEVTRCLAISRDWRADSALAAGGAFQRALDSLARAEQRQADSLAAAKSEKAGAAGAARAARWTECALHEHITAGVVDRAAMFAACREPPVKADLLAYLARRRPYVADSVTYWLGAYVYQETP